MKQPLQTGSFSLDFSHTQGFRLFSWKEVFSPESYAYLQKSFEEIDWAKIEHPFYSQYESFVLPSDKHGLSALYSPSFFFPFKNKLESVLKVSLQPRIRLAAHKLISADAIGIHNDYSDPDLGNENFRFIFQFARPLQLLSGGELTFLASRYTQEVIRQYPYASNEGICFEITRQSYHKVTPVEGERYTLVMYLWEEGRKYHDLSIKISD